MQPKVVCHDGTCHQCNGEGTVITIEANPLPVSLCPECLAGLINDATGIRSAIVERWREIKRKESEARRKYLEDLEQKAREDVERVAGTNRGMSDKEG